MTPHTYFLRFDIAQCWQRWALSFLNPLQGPHSRCRKLEQRENFVSFAQEGGGEMRCRATYLVFPARLNCRTARRNALGLHQKMLDRKKERLSTLLFLSVCVVQRSDSSLIVMLSCRSQTTSSLLCYAQNSQKTPFFIQWQTFRTFCSVS